MQQLCPHPGATGDLCSQSLLPSILSLPEQGHREVTQCHLRAKLTKGNKFHGINPRSGPVESWKQCGGADRPSPPTSRDILVPLDHQTGLRSGSGTHPPAPAGVPPGAAGQSLLQRGSHHGDPHTTSGESQPWCLEQLLPLFSTDRCSSHRFSLLSPAVLLQVAFPLLQFVT